MKLFNIFRRTMCLLLACLLLTGCAISELIPGRGSDTPEKPGTSSSGKPGASEPSVETTEETVPETEPPTCPPDGDPGDVTCQGSYTGQVSASTVVATLGETSLTAGELQLLYGLEVGAWRTSGTEPAPDWDQGLDTQLCPFEGTAVTWQQYFLQNALNRWQTWHGLILDSQTAVMPLDPEYLPYEGNYERYMLETMPAVKVLYGYDPSYKVNSLHQEFIDALPELLSSLGGADVLAKQLGGGTGAQLQALAELMNYAYAYFTFAYDYLGVTDEDVQALLGSEDGTTVTFRHILIKPEGSGEEAWTAAESKARNILDVDYANSRKRNEGTFAYFANLYSQDEGTRLSGGRYCGVSRGQVPEALETWLFDSARQSGDMTVVRSDLGWHALYFSGSENTALTLARAKANAQAAAALITKVREALPMEVDYSAIKLSAPEADAIGAQALLYPDIAHERIPDIPVHIQQDYTQSKYGAFPLVSYGCGIATLAMLATYMCDTWLTPAALAKVYGDYCSNSGTDARLIDDAGPELGYFLEYKTYEWREARESMAEGHVAIVLQHKGYFTRGGHYLVLRKLNEDGTVSIRDSNLYNYGKLLPHREDNFTWDQIVPRGVQYWIFQDKITTIGSCHRCGNGTAPEGLLLTEYTCERCTAALGRYNDFLALSAS